MKLKKLKKLINKLHKKCGNVDVEFWDNEGTALEIESIGHFNFVKDVTVTLKPQETEQPTIDLTHQEC